MSWGFVCIYIFLFSLLLSLSLTPLSRKIALKLRILDIPEDRKLHKEPKPLLGGTAIYLAFNLTIIVNIGIVLLFKSSPWIEGLLPPEIADKLAGVGIRYKQLAAIFIGGTFIMLLGLIDDIRRMSARLKLAGQLAAALFLIGSGVRASLFMTNAYLSWLITLLWIIAITNAFNLMDNMDGLTAGVAFISSILFLAVSLQQGQFLVSAILAAFVGSILGFLKYNINPASIFMGDAGSLFIGYTMGTLTILNTYYTPSSRTFLPVIMPILILGVPIFDTLSVICLRLKNKQSIFTADKRHFSHRLLRLGMTQKQAVSFVYLVTFCVGINALLLTSLSLSGAIILLSATLSIFGIIIFLELVSAKKRNEK